MNPTFAETYADFATSLRYEDIPTPVVQHAKKLILDIIANTIGGYEWTESGRPILAAMRNLNRGTSGVTVFATGETMSSEWASLANGALAHSLDYDNHHAAGVIHAGGSVVTAALAAGEEEEASGQELIAAIVIGYEIICRLAMALGPHSSHELGFHPTGTCAVFSSSAVIGRLRGHDAPTIVNALGLNGSQASGSMQYVTTGAWNKGLHPGLANHSAFLAMSLAESGVIGASDAIEGEYGFLNAYSRRPHFEAAIADLGQRFETVNMAIKPYALCRYTHQTLDLLSKLQQDESMRTEDIISIAIEMPSYGVQLVGTPIERKRNPQSAVDAQFSAPFAAALALTERDATLETVSRVLAEGIGPEFQRLMDITTVDSSPDLDAIHPEYWPGRVVLETPRGRIERSAKVLRGEAALPMSIEEVANKLAEMAPRHDPSVREAVVSAVESLESTSVVDLVKPLKATSEAVGKKR